VDLRTYTAGEYRQQYEFKSFTPTPVNMDWVSTDPELNALLSRADHSLGALHAYSKIVPNVDFFIEMHVVKEATTSSRIEGTQTNMGEAILRKSEIDPEKRDDWQEVQNYIAAMNYAVKRLDKIPVSTRLLKETHEILLSKGRGRAKSPGEFRRSQNWIGGSTIQKATFVPPSHEEIPALLGDLEKFLHNDRNHVPPLVRIAIAHYQFETIHPFLDGNGRTGRLLITLFLVDKGLLVRPTLYLSEYFERNRAEYYDRLSLVRSRNDLIQWITFFLRAVDETATKGVSTLEKIQELASEIEGKKLVRLGRRFNAGKELLNALYRRPHTSSGDVVKLLGVTPKSANALIDEFVKQKILVEVTGWKRNRQFVFREYLKLFEK
jgi:Fic family protein